MTANTYGRQVVVPLTNKSGGGVIAGDVVVVDTSNNDAFTTSTAGAFTGLIGVAQEAIASNATGRVLTSGYAALVNVNASVTRGNFGKTHTVVKQAADAGASRVAGAFCQFLTGGTTPDAHLFGLADNTSGAGTGTLTTVKDEGSNLSTAVVSLDFVGAGVTATGTTAVTVTIPSGGYIGYILVREQQTAGTSGGTATSGSYQTRVLNTEVTDTNNDCTLASNQITLAAGTYECRITCPTWKTDSHKARLRNVTDSSTVLVGTSEYGDGTSGLAQTTSVIVGRFTIAASKALEVQHQFQTTRATNGLGVAATMTEVEVYTVAEFHRVS